MLEVQRVKGLAAKPVIDMDIVVTDDRAIMIGVIQRLEELGFRHVGDLEIVGKEAGGGKK